MNTYSIYSIRKEYKEFNTFLFNVDAFTPDHCREILKAKHNITNTKYVVIVETTAGASIVVQNKFMQFITEK